MSDESLHVDEDVVAEDARELREGSSDAGVELERLETLERHRMLTHAADVNALDSHREKSPHYEKDEDGNWVYVGPEDSGETEDATD